MNKQNYETGGRPENLEAEIKVFTNSLPYWSKHLAQKILGESQISNNEINTSYSYLLEELGLQDATEKPDIDIVFNSTVEGKHKADLLFSRLDNVAGVNALIEGQTISFCPNLTIVYGTNGSGKSGYTRLLKQVFHSKSPENILKNIHLENGHKDIAARFTFTSNNTETTLTFADKGRAEFEQFSVFDGKSVVRHLDQRNEFEFRPAGLAFFAGYTSALVLVEQKLQAEVELKKAGNTPQDLAEMFDGDSDIKSLVLQIGPNTKTDELVKYTPFSEEDNQKRQKVTREYDELLLASKSKEKEIKNLETIKKLLVDNKLSIEKLNHYFSEEYLTKVKEAIADCTEKEAIAKTEGVESFNTSRILGIGTDEWKNFISSAEAFSLKQESQSDIYPQEESFCLLCHQPLSEEARNLIANYWVFIKSLAEENAKKALEILLRIEHGFEKFNFNLFPEDSLLTIWLNEKYPEFLQSLKAAILEQKALSESVIAAVRSKISLSQAPLSVELSHHAEIISSIEATIKTLHEDAMGKQIAELLKEKRFLEHKEKFNTHFPKFQTCLKNLNWVSLAEKANFRKFKTESTNGEKALSEKYFNQRYVDTFNEECRRLNGSFGIEISHTGSAGKSYRQLKLKGNNPNSILSEGEQKVIAIADFLAEMTLSEINRGIIFDDPVTSLDETRKSEIAKRLVQECISKQTIIFTHDLVFVSALIAYCSDMKALHNCHWIENRNGVPGQIWLNNAPSYEREYRNAEPAKKHYNEAKKDDCPPAAREFLLKSGFAALRTSYEVLVINDLFKNVVQRFNERVSVDSLSSVYFDTELIDELQDSFGQCCRYMEGHAHSDKYAYKKPEPSNLNEEIQRFETVRNKIKKSKRPVA